MKAIIEFDLPEDQEEYEIHSSARFMYSALSDLKQELRTMLKHGHSFKTAEEAVEGISNMFNELLCDNNLEIL